MRIDWTGVSARTSGMLMTVVRTNQRPGKFSGIGDFGEKKTRHREIEMQ